MKKAKAVVLSLVLAMSVMVGLVACNEKEEHVHSYGAWQTVKAATCTEDGEEKRVCSECGDEQKRALESRGSHSYGRWQETKEAKCEEAGEEERVCSECGDVQTREIEPLGYHSYGRWQVEQEATCGIAGARKRTCTVCGKEEIQDIEALTHRYGNWQIVKPTDEEPGSAVKVCSRCVDGIEGHTVSVVLPVLTDEGYTKVAKGNEPSCLKGSITIYTITISGEVFEFESETEALGHRYGDWTVEAPSDIEGGIATRYCDRCEPGTAGHVETKSLPALTDEGYTKVSDTATCTENGEGKYEITIDGEKIEFTLGTEAKGHTYGAWKIEMPTEDKKGKASKECSVCDGETKGHKVEIELPMLGDSGYTIECEKVQDCTQSTTGTYKYSYLDEVISFEAAIQGGHRFNWTIKAMPTLTTTGVVSAVCAKCGVVINETEIPMLTDPMYTLAEDTATCIDGGMGTFTTKIGNGTLTLYASTLPLGHEYDKDTNKCIRCEEEKGLFDSMFRGTWLPDTSLSSTGTSTAPTIVIEKDSITIGGVPASADDEMTSDSNRNGYLKTIKVDGVEHDLIVTRCMYINGDDVKTVYTLAYSTKNSGSNTQSYVYYYNEDKNFPEFDKDSWGAWGTGSSSWTLVQGRIVEIKGVHGYITEYRVTKDGFTVRVKAETGSTVGDDYLGQGINWHEYTVTYNATTKTVDNLKRRNYELHPERVGIYVSDDGKYTAEYTKDGSFYFNDRYCAFGEEQGPYFMYDSAMWRLTYDAKGKTLTINCVWFGVVNVVLTLQN